MILRGPAGGFGGGVSLTAPQLSSPVLGSLGSATSHAPPAGSAAKSARTSATSAGKHRDQRRDRSEALSMA
jgi:hypothetical protein